MIETIRKLIKFLARLINIAIICLFYSYPLVEGTLGLGDAVFNNIPLLLNFYRQVKPILLKYNEQSWLSLAIFILIYYFFVRRDRVPFTNQKINLTLRFHAVQCLVIFMVLSLWAYIYANVPLEMQDTLLCQMFGCSGYFFTFGTCVYSIYKALRGEEPQVPVISQAARDHLQGKN